MATTNLGELLVKIGADISGAKKKFAEIKKELTDMGGEGEKTARRLQRNFDTLEKNANSAAASVSKTANEVGDLSVETGRLGGAGSQAAAGLDKVGGAADQAGKKVETLNKTLKNNRGAQAQTATVTGASEYAMLNFGRVAEDSAYGVRGVANNITPLIQSLQILKTRAQEAGTTVSRALVGSLLGPGGLLVAVGVVSTLLIKFGPQIKEMIGNASREAAVDVEDLTNKIKNLISVLDEVTQIDVLKQTSEAMADRISAMKQDIQDLRDTLREETGGRPAPGREKQLAAEARAIRDRVRQTEESKKKIDEEIESIESAIVTRREYSDIVNSLETDVVSLLKEQAREAEAAELVNEQRRIQRSILGDVHSAERELTRAIAEDAAGIEKHWEELHKKRLAQIEEERKAELAKFKEKLRQIEALESIGTQYAGGRTFADFSAEDDAIKAFQRQQRQALYPGDPPEIIKLDPTRARDYFDEVLNLISDTTQKIKVLHEIGKTGLVDPDKISRKQANEIIKAMDDLDLSTEEGRQAFDQLAAALQKIEFGAGIVNKIRDAVDGLANAIADAITNVLFFDRLQRDSMLAQLNMRRYQLNEELKALQQSQVDRLASEEDYARRVQEISAEMNSGINQERRQMLAMQLADLTSALESQSISQAEYAARVRTVQADLALANREWAKATANVWKRTFQTIGDFAKQILKQVIRDIAAALVKAILLKTVFAALRIGTGGTFGSVFASALIGRASGGPVTAGRGYIVGERGPELFVPSTGGSITQPRVAAQPVILNGSLRIGVGELYFELEQYKSQHGLA